MFIIDTKLREREATDNPIQVGILGAGEVSLGLVNQIERHVPGMRVAAIFNRTSSKAERNYRIAGAERVLHASNSEEVDECIDMRTPCIAGTSDALLRSRKIDAVVEVTGTIDVAFEWIMTALKEGKKVVSFNAELDATLGPYLQQVAKMHNTRYTLGDGDQPGVTLDLFRHVKMMGFTPLVCGNIKGFLNHHRTPETQKEFADLYGLSVDKVTSFTDGTKVAFEQASIANATGMQVAQRGMISIRHEGHIDELTGRYDLEHLKQLGGIVEMVVGAKPPPGVFVFATTDDPVSKRFLDYFKLGKGPLYSFYVPHHLQFFEFPFSIARLVDYDDGTVDSLDQIRVEVIAVSKKDLKAGDILDGIGGYAHYGLCENSRLVQKEKLLPAAFAEGKVLIRDIKKDTAISYDDVNQDTCGPAEKAYHSFVTGMNQAR